MIVEIFQCLFLQIFCLYIINIFVFQPFSVLPRIHFADSASHVSHTHKDKEVYSQKLKLQKHNRDVLLNDFFHIIIPIVSLILV